MPKAFQEYTKKLKRGRGRGWRRR